MTNSTSEIRVYASCLASYNAGRLFGAWIDCSDDSDEIDAEISAMLAKSPTVGAEEWAFHDLEGPGVSLLSEYSSTAEIARLVSIVGEHGADIVRAASTVSSDLDDLERTIEEFRGTAESLADWAQEYSEDMGQEVPSWLVVDWERTGEMLADGCSVVRMDGQVWIFG